MADVSDQFVPSDGTSSSTSGYAGIVEVLQLTISNHLGQNVDARGVFTEIETTNSIFEPGIRGSVLVYDAQGMITRLPIVGEEKLFLSYSTPGNDPKTGEFRIWKITDETPDSKGASSTYRLHFCGKEMFNNAKKIVAKSYVNTDDVSAIVKDIMTTYLETEKEVDARGVIRDPAKKLVIPMYRPFEAVDMLMRRAYSGDPAKSDYFLLFERFDKWYLRMFDSLCESPINKRYNFRGDSLPGDVYQSAIDPNASIDTWYVYASDKYLEDSVKARDIRRVINMRIESRFDSLQKIREGGYDGEVVSYSIVDKEVTSKTFKHLRDGNVKIGGGVDPYGTPLAIGRSMKERTNTQEFIAQYSGIENGYSGTQASKVYFRLKDPEEKDGVVKKSGNAYQSLRVLLNQVRVTISVPGDTMVDVGDVVHLAIPRFDSVGGEEQPDKFVYGRYVVGSMRDSILVPDKHVSVLDLYRDGYMTPISGSEFHEDL